MSTYIELTNTVLKLLNETLLNDTSFDGARGLHATVKTHVRNVVSKINKHYMKWPFNAAEHTMNLVDGQEEYGWPQNFRVVDWNSFYLVKDETLNLNTKKLRKLSRDDWYKKLRSKDYDTGTDGRGIPEFIFEAHGRGFGVSPSPIEPYEIRFRYFINPPPLIDKNDMCTIPEEWEFVIIDGVMYYMNLFKENHEVAASFKQDYRAGMSQMRTELINSYDYMQDTRVFVDNPGSNGR